MVTLLAEFDVAFFANSGIPGGPAETKSGEEGHTPGNQVAEDGDVIKVGIGEIIGAEQGQDNCGQTETGSVDKGNDLDDYNPFNNFRYTPSYSAGKTKPYFPTNLY